MLSTRYANLSKTAWEESMNPDGKMHHSVCNQNVVRPFEVHDDVKKTREGEVHCFEPMPTTYEQLSHSAKNLGYEEKGFKVIHAAVSKETGNALFPSKNAVRGVENKGLANYQHMLAEDRKQNCEKVKVLSLDAYLSENYDGDGPIYILQIVVEGFDGDVLLQEKMYSRE